MTDFLIMVHCEQELSSLFDAIKRRIVVCESCFAYSFEHNANFFRFLHNEDYNPELVNGEDGYLYYKYEIQITSIRDIEEVGHQVELAKIIKKYLIEMGCIAEICAGFEHLL